MTMLIHTTYLLSGDRHVVRDVGEDGRLDEESSLAGPRAARHQGRSLALPALDQSEDLLQLFAVDLPTRRHRRSVAGFRRAGESDDPTQEVRNTFVLHAGRSRFSKTVLVIRRTILRKAS